MSGSDARRVVALEERVAVLERELMLCGREIAALRDSAEPPARPARVSHNNTRRADD